MRQWGFLAASGIVLIMLLNSFAASRAGSPGAAVTGSIKTNELGKVPILEYHLIQPKTGEWARSAQELRHDLESLYQAGYRSLSMNDYIRGKIDLAAFTHPVVFTFDDSSPGQFRYKVFNGKKEIDPDCAVGIFMEFNKRHPDFGMHAIFFVLPAAAEPHKLFGQPEYEKEKLKELASLGFELGNHTYWHANLAKFDAATIQKQLALAVQAIQSAVPGYGVHVLALPLGVYPKNINLAIEGSYKGIAYHNDAILEVSGGPAPSPFSSRRDLLHLRRIQVQGNATQNLIRNFEKHPGEVFTSDGNANTISFPAALKSEFNASGFKSLQVRPY